MTLNADLVRGIAARLGMSVANLHDEQLERVALDLVAEFGEREVTSTEFASVIWRYQPGRPSAEPPRSSYKPTLTMLKALRFEEKHPPGEAVAGKHRDRVIREKLGVTPSIYAAVLNRAIDDPVCIAKLPQLCARLRRLRERRRLLRTSAKVVDG